MFRGSFRDDLKDFGLCHDQQQAGEYAWGSVRKSVTV